MKIERWLAVTAAGIGALAVGVVAVAAAPSPSPSASGKSYGQVFVDKLANILHLDSKTTLSDLQQAEIATVNQMVTDGRITRAQGDSIINRIKSGQGMGLIPFGGRQFRGGLGPFGADRSLMQDLKTASLNAAAGALKLSSSSLQSQLESGKTLSQIESAQGVSDSTVRAAVHKAAQAVLDKAVKAGTITAQQETMILNGIDNGRGLFVGRGFHHMEGPPAGTSPAPNWPTSWQST